MSDDEIHFSRHASDSTDDPMEMTFSMRMPHELRILGGRKARLLGLSLSEYIRHLLAAEIDKDTVHDRGDSCVLRKGPRQGPQGDGS